MVALRGGGDGRDDPIGGHANGGLVVENGWCCGWCARSEERRVGKEC